MDTLRNEELPGAGGDMPIRLRDASWSVRLSWSSLERSALEVYVGDRLVDVVVPTTLVSGALRGACSTTDGRGRVTLAWGMFDAERDDLPQVTFRRRRLRGSVRFGGETFTVGDRFWISAADGRFTEVTVTCRAGEDGSEPDVERRTVRVLRHRRTGAR